jgi:PAS domain S-box-containing protein
VPEPNEAPRIVVPSGEPLLELLRDAQAMAHIGAWRLDLATNVVQWSDEVFRIYEIERQEFVDLGSALACYPAESRALLDPALERARTERLPFELKVPFVSRKGTHRWVHVIGRPIAEGDTVVALAGTIQDVTRAEEAEQLNRRIVGVLNEYPDIVAVTDRSGAVAWCNRTAAEFLGGPGGIRHPHTLLPPWALAKLLDVGLPAARESGHWSGELALRMPDHTELPMMATVLVLRDAQHEVESTTYLLKDITHEREQQRRLAASETKFRDAFRVSPVGMALAAPDGMLLEVNDAFCRMMGYSRAELLRMDFQAITHPDDIDRNVELLHLARQGDLPTYSIEKRYIAKDGRVIHALTTVAVLRDEAGRMTGLLGHIQDITERKREEASRQVLERQFHMLAQQESFAAVAHVVAREFNNLLVGLLGASGLAKLDLPPDSPARAPIELVERTAQRGAELIRQLVAYSGSARSHSERFDFAALVREMQPLLLAAVAHRATLRIDLDPAGVPIRADKAQVRQLLMNLVMNAAEAMGRRGGSILIRSETRLGGGVALDGLVVDARNDGLDYNVIAVEDTGSGMDTDTLHRIFEPFYTTKADGHGLGLPAAIGIVRSNGGFLAVSSELGRGTTMTFGFPAAGPDDPDPSIGTPRSERSQRGPVLVAEDDATTRNVAGMVLRREGYETLMAADGQLALELFESNPDRICALVLDLMMPRMNGDVVMKAIRARRPDIPVIVITGFRESETAEAVASLQPDAILDKPFRPEDLMEAVRTALRSRR